MNEMPLNQLSPRLRHWLLFIASRTGEKRLDVLARLNLCESDASFERRVFEEVLRCHRDLPAPASKVTWPYSS